MNLNEFKLFVIKTAKEYISENKELDEEAILKQPKAPKAPKLSKPSFTKKGVNEVPKEPKAPKLPTTATISESYSPEKIKVLAEEMKKINKKIDLRNPLINPDFFDILSEGDDKEIQNDRWKNIYNYEIPKDNLR